MGRSLQSGFTLIETLVVVIIIGVLMFVIFPNYIHPREQSTAVRLADSFRVHATAFKNFAEERDNSPDQPDTEELPDLIKERVPDTSSDSIVGGYWEWSWNYPDKQLEVRLVQHNANIQLIERVDHLLDDGNLATGMMTGDLDQLRMILQH